MSLSESGKWVGHEGSKKSIAGLLWAPVTGASSVSRFPLNRKNRIIPERKRKENMAYPLFLIKQTIFPEMSFTSRSKMFLHVQKALLHPVLRY
ncbi:MAG: hypothetical protein ABFR82_15820 [Nitrospirota bacterium]